MKKLCDSLTKHICIVLYVYNERQSTNGHTLISLTNKARTIIGDGDSRR